MLLIECNNIKKYYGDKLILDVEDLKIYDGDRIGIVGVNGVGKTTLINVLSQRLDPDEGFIRLHGIYSYVSQLESPEGMDIDGEMASKFNIPNRWNEDMSGGEKTRFKLAEAFIENNPILFADEPTSNLDMEGIELIGERLKEFKGALLLISHDRSLLDILCNKILEIEHGKIKIYNGNYSDYYEQKRIEMERKEFEYSQYSKEKKRIKSMINDIRQKEQGIKKAPRRMGNSEARLHKMGDQRAKANLNRAIKNMEKRLEHLEVKGKPMEQDIIKLDIQDANKLYSKIIIEGKKINKSFKDKIIFKNAEFDIFNGSKTALIGPNGCGKTTLIKMIMNRDRGINIAKGAKIGYFSQDMNILDDRLTIIDNVMNTSVYDETFARILLARLLFKRESVYKEVGLLSGGERVKVSFAKLMLQDNNLLVLDEPNNYLDIKSLEVVEDTLEDYEGTLLFISHDRRFVSKIANQIITIENHKIKIFNGGYEEYIDKKKKIKNKNEHKEEIFILENRLSEIIGRLSMTSKDEEKEMLDIEYHSVLQSLRKLREI